MKTLQSMLTQEVNEKIARHNANDKLNSFLSLNKDCHERFKEVADRDRFCFVQENNKISRELTSYIHENFHGKKVLVTLHGLTLDGVIEHELIRSYEGRTFTNETAFRREFEEPTFSAPETIALRVNTGDKLTSHLYTVNDIQLVVEQQISLL